MIVPDQVLTVAQMRGAEAALIAGGETVSSLMAKAGHGAADWVWRLAGHRRVTVLCGPGNNGGDGWVIAETLRARGGSVAVIMAAEPRTEAAQAARGAYQGVVLMPDQAPDRHGEVLVDCLYGTGLTRGLVDADRDLLHALADTHAHRVAVDVPSGIDSDNGACLTPELPCYDLTLALGAWKCAHALMPAHAIMGDLRLVPIGCGAVRGAGRMLRRPATIAAPAPDAHKYTRGLLGVVAGQLAGAALLAARAASGAGAGYVKLMAARPLATPPDLVATDDTLIDDARLAALLLGPGLGTDGAAGDRMKALMRDGVARGLAMVIDGDALRMLTPAMLVGRAGMVAEHHGPTVLTPHEGELAALENRFGIKSGGSRIERARALAAEAGVVVVAKGPDTVIAAPDGTWLAAPGAPSWLSVAGSGDVLAGTIASRLATGIPAFAAAAQGVWLHGEAARLAPVPFTAGELALAVPAALRDAL